ncbi:hypothetical protein [Pseudactinotalea sp. HY158]|uniref:hypothetical protein n=1 Tax=Pseudactinotalea sp. HY158 TaxID=2654547 RepID=UPI001E29CD71|nr:hypothetical protein [Pseudactinotalea sp. HY158]
MTTVEKYTQELTFALRLRDVPGEVIGDAIAQVESHLAESGEDPVAAFGPASEYAASFRDEQRPARRWPWYVAGWLLGFLFGSILIDGMFGQIRHEEILWGVHPVAAIVVGALGLVGCFVAMLVIAADRIKDPR